MSQNYHPTVPPPPPPSLLSGALVDKIRSHPTGPQEPALLSPQPPSPFSPVLL